MVSILSGEQYLQEKLLYIPFYNLQYTYKETETPKAPFNKMHVNHQKWTSRHCNVTGALNLKEIGKFT